MEIKKRTPVYFLVTQEQKKELKKRAHEAEKNISVFCRDLILPTEKTK